MTAKLKINTLKELTTFSYLTIKTIAKEFMKQYMKSL